MSAIYKLAKATFEGEQIEGFSDGWEFRYIKNGTDFIAYAQHPDHPQLPHFTDLVYLTSSPTSPDSLASIAESLEDLTPSFMEALADISEQLITIGEFFRHLNNGEVGLKISHFGINGLPDELQFTITEKGLPA